ncbi:MAG: riboflavin synthase [Acidobacteriota bacterium]|nr:riboflavin synthase [Acidobacteriota bacterium]
MFTGIIQETGKILAKAQNPSGVIFEVNVGSLLSDLELGDSISIDGVCLTVAEEKDQSIVLEATPETLKLTNLGGLSEGDFVNLEPPAKLSDFLGGHLVQGHVDGTGEVLSISEEGNSQVFRISAPQGVLRYCTFKGSVTVNGVSLTISALDSDSFEITIIPHTMEVTNFKDLQKGSVVNLEADVISKYVESHLSHYLKSQGKRLLAFLLTGFFLSSTLLFGEDFLVGEKSILVYQSEDRQQRQSQFVLRLARYRPDIFLEWESLSHQGTLHLYREAVQEAKIFHLSSLFEVGVDMESGDAMTVWLSEKVYRELTEKGSSKIRLNRLPVTLSLMEEGSFTLTVDKQVVEIPVIHVQDDRKGLWMFYKNPENPLLVAYHSTYFSQHLKTVSTASTNKLRWIQQLPPVK